jgi:hypothetical protein
MTLPAVDSIDTYGGELNEVAAVTDPTTDRPATGANQAYASVAEMTHTAIRAWRALVGHATTPTDPTTSVHDAVWGSDNSLKPTIARSGAGVYTITWAATVDDELGEEHTVSLRRAWANVEGTTAYVALATVTSANVVTVRVFDMAGAANDAVGSTITVFVV